MRKILLVLAVLGFGWSVYAYWSHIQVARGISPPGCTLSATFRCEDVLASPYARWLGIPVPLWAMGYYAVLIWSVVRTSRHRGWRLWVVWWALLGVTVSGALLWIMQTRIQATCPICLVGDGIILAFLAGAVWAFRVDLRHWRDGWRSAAALRRGVTFSLIGLLFLLWWGYPSVPNERSSAADTQRLPPVSGTAGFSRPPESDVEDICATATVPPEWQSVLQQLPPPVQIPHGMCTYISGGPRSPIQIVEFSDFQCPFCARMAFIFERLIARYGDRLGIRFCHFPLDAACNPAIQHPPGPHPLACQLARIAECAARAGKFLQVHNEMFLYQREIQAWLAGRIPGSTLATELSACAERPEIARRVEAQVQLGIELGVRATPTVFFNGHPLPGGVVPAGVLCRLIQQSVATQSGEPPADDHARREENTMARKWKQVIQTERAPFPVGPYSQAIRVGPWVFLSGQIAIDPATQQMVQGSIEEETERVMQNLLAVLEAAGGTPDHLVQVTIYLKDIHDFPKVNQVYARYVGERPPARATVAVAALPKDARVEIAAIAYIPET